MRASEQWSRNSASGLSGCKASGPSHGAVEQSDGRKASARGGSRRRQRSGRAWPRPWRQPGPSCGHRDPLRASSLAAPLQLRDHTGLQPHIHLSHLSARARTAFPMVTLHFPHSVLLVQFCFLPVPVVIFLCIETLSDFRNRGSCSHRCPETIVNLTLRDPRRCTGPHVHEALPPGPRTEEESRRSRRPSLSHIRSFSKSFLAPKYHQLSNVIDCGGTKNSLKMKNHKQSLDFHLVPFLPLAGRQSFKSASLTCVHAWP